MYKFQMKTWNLFYGSFQALFDVNLNIEEKCISAFIGPSDVGNPHCLKPSTG